MIILRLCLVVSSWSVHNTYVPLAWNGRNTFVPALLNQNTKLAAKHWDWELPPEVGHRKISAKPKIFRNCILEHKIFREGFWVPFIIYNLRTKANCHLRWRCHGRFYVLSWLIMAQLCFFADRLLGRHRLQPAASWAAKAAATSMTRTNVSKSCAEAVKVWETRFATEDVVVLLPTCDLHAMLLVNKVWLCLCNIKAWPSPEQFWKRWRQAFMDAG